MTTPKLKRSEIEILLEENQRLRQEIDALYAAADAREQQLLAATHAMDDILLEMESQRNTLKRKNKQLLELNAYIRSINDAMNSILVVVDISGQVTQTNRVFSEDLGWTEEELPQIHVDMLFPADVLARLAKDSGLSSGSLVVSFITHRGQLEFEMPLLKIDGTITDAVYLVKGEQFYSHQGKLQGILLTATDISELRQRELALLQSEEALQIAKAEADAANQAKGDFLANMSHEIRTPLNAIIGFTKLCLHSSLTEKQRDHLNKVDVASHSLSHLINDVLDLSKIEAGKLEMECVSFNLHQVLSNVRHVMWFEIARRGLTFSMHLDPDVPSHLKGDPLRLQQVLVNLIGNAVKFTDNGEVSVAVSRKKNRAKKSATLIFQVKDTGIGMTEKQLSRLFSKYHQADPSTTRRFGGTGLGLTISRKLIGLMNGDISIQSVYGEGTQCEFSAKFALASDTEQPHVGMPEPNETPALPQISTLEGAHVLVVDDNSINREMIRELLGSLGMIVDQVSSGELAIDAISRQSYSLILMDLRMAGMDGIETTKALRKLPNGKQTPVIALTANTTGNMAETCLRAGMDDYLPKPVDFRRLIQVIASHLQHSVPLNQQAEPDSPAVYEPSQALLRVGSNLKVYLKMVQRFLDQYDDHVQAIGVAIQDNDFATMKHKLHELKGVAATLGAEKLRLVCAETEALVLERANGEQGAYTEVLNELAILEPQLRQYLTEHPLK